MLDERQKALARYMVETMRPGSEMTLEQLNSINNLQVFRIYELYEFVHDVLRESPRWFKFTKEDKVEKSIIYRHQEY